MAFPPHQQQQLLFGDTLRFLKSISFYHRWAARAMFSGGFEL
jgi:hypothetical protein